MSEIRWGFVVFGSEFDERAERLGALSDSVLITDANDVDTVASEMRRLGPDAVIVDWDMPRMDGVEAMRRLRETMPELQFIVLTTFDTDEYIFDAIITHGAYCNERS